VTLENVRLSRRRLDDIARRLTAVPGVVAVMLGGSRGRGEPAPDSDVDLGVYYRPPLDVATLGALARELAGPGAQVTAPGEWGPWVDGGSWLRIDDVPVDWIYRDLDRVLAAWRDARRGRYAWHAQVGHPLGVLDVAYAGEVALGVVLADPSGELTRLHRDARVYPALLSDALVARLEEAAFTVRIARKAAGRGEVTYVAGCVFRAVGVCAHALHAHAGRWLINEKGAVTAAGALPGAPARFAVRAHGLLGAIGNAPAELEATLDAAAGLVEEVRAACAR
jgi:predicted nucleotidyltransferase